MSSVAKIWNHMRHFLIICIALMLTGCATKEYLNAQTECSPAAFQRYPVNSVQMYVQRTRSVQVATGAEECESRTEGNRTYTRCKPEMRTRSVPYQSLEMVDMNAQARNAYLQNCTARLCVKRFGNPACETAQTSPASPVVANPATNAVVTNPAANAVTTKTPKSPKSAGTAPGTKPVPKSRDTSADDDDDDDD